MKIHTNEYKNKLKLFGRQLDSKIRYELNGVTIELGTEELNSITPKYEGSILKSVMKQLDIDSNVEIPLNTIINYQFGLFIDRYYETEDENYQSNINYYNYINNSYVLLNAGIDYNIGDSIIGTIYNYQDWEYLDFGNYIVRKIERKEDTKSWQITCYDKMLYSMKNYENLGVTYPITIRNYISALCNHLGLVFANSSDTFANYDKEIQNELYLDVDGNSLDYKFRDVLDELAQVTASTICINNNDELEIRYLNDTEDTINEEYLKDVNVEFGEKYGPVNSIVISRASESDSVYLRDEESVTENGLCEIKISDNQILNFNDRSDYLEDILNQLNGLEYYVNDFSSTGITYYDLCDIYNIQVGNNTYKCIMLNDEINVSQGLVENVFTELLEQSETDYSKADKTDRKVNQTYIIANKQEGKITSLTSRTDRIEEEVGNTYTKEQVNQLLQTAETGLTNTFSEAGGNNIFRNTGLWFVTNDNNNPYEFWNGIAVRVQEEKASNRNAICLKNSSFSQSETVANGRYTVSFKYKKLIALAVAKVYINDIEYVLSETEDTEFINIVEVNSQNINVTFVSDIDNSCEIYDLMVNAGEVRLAYSQNQNETTTDTVNISKGITITSSDIDVKFKADADGIRTLDSSNTVLTKFTDRGMTTKEAIIQNKSQIVGTLWQEVGNQTWITRL